jgi:hypothetical protein
LDFSAVSAPTGNQPLPGSPGPGGNQTQAQAVLAVSPSAMVVDTEVAPSAVYVYGIYSSNEATGMDLPSVGVDGSNEVRPVYHRDLVAVVSNVQASTYEPNTLQRNMRDASWRNQHIERHASVLEEVRSTRTLIPMKFGVVHSSDEAVEDMLEANYHKYAATLDHVAGKVEWELRVTRDMDRLLRKVRESDRKVEDSLEVISKGVVLFVKEEMERIDTMGTEAAELTTEHCIRRSHAALLDCAVAGVLKPDSVKDQADVILHSAYLVAPENEQAMRDEIERLASEYEELGFHFELSGPMPPFHFVRSDGSDSLDG